MQTPGQLAQGRTNEGRLLSRRPAFRALRTAALSQAVSWAIAHHWHGEELDPIWRDIDERNGSSDWCRKIDHHEHGWEHIMPQRTNVQAPPRPGREVLQEWLDTFGKHLGRPHENAPESWPSPWSNPMSLLHEYCLQSDLFNPLEAAGVQGPAPHHHASVSGLPMLLKAFDCYFHSQRDHLIVGMVRMEARAILAALTTDQLKALIGDEAPSPRQRDSQVLEKEHHYRAAFNYIKLSMVQQAVVVVNGVFTRWKTDPMAGSHRPVPTENLLSRFGRTFTHLWRFASSHTALCLVEDAQLLGSLPRHLDHPQAAEASETRPQSGISASHVQLLQDHLRRRATEHAQSLIREGQTAVADPDLAQALQLFANIARQGQAE